MIPSITNVGGMAPVASAMHVLLGDYGKTLEFEKSWWKSKYNYQLAPTNLLTTQKVTADVMAAKIVPHATSTSVSCKVQFRSVA